MIPEHPPVTRTYGKQGLPYRGYAKPPPQWIPKSPIRSIESSSNSQLETGTSSDGGDSDWLDESTARSRRQTMNKSKKTTRGAAAVKISTLPSQKEKFCSAQTENEPMKTVKNPSPHFRRPLVVYRKRRVIPDISDSDEGDQPSENSKNPSSSCVSTQPHPKIASISVEQKPISPGPTTDTIDSPCRASPTVERMRVPTRRNLIRSPLVSVQRRATRPRARHTEVKARPPSSSDSPQPRHTILREKTNITKSNNSPKIIIPRLSMVKSAPLNQKLTHPKPIPKASKPPEAIIHSLLYSNSSPVARRVRGRMSLVTSSVRRSRVQPRLTTEIPQTAKTSTGSSLRPASLTSSTPQKVPRLKQTIKAVKIPVSSPLARRQAALSPYAIITTNPGASTSLLKTCNQSSIMNFSTSIKNFASLLKTKPLKCDQVLTGRWKKIGEASFSEVYSWTPSPNLLSKSSSDNHLKTVLKVIPIKRSPKHSHRPITTSIINSNNDGDRSNLACHSNEFPSETDWSDAEKEVKLTKLLGSSHGTKGFIDFRGCLIVSGEYPEALLKEWDRYQKRFPKQAQNARPSKFDSKQLYCCILLGHAGTDLEACELNEWQQAASIFSQIISSLSRAEKDYEFEHRDLHWGNLLIQPVEKLSDSNIPKSTDGELGELNNLAKSSLDSNLIRTDPLASGTSGIAVSIIDYGISRARYIASRSSHNSQRRQAEVLWTEPDPTIFGASTPDGDYQFECYDLMNILRKGKSWNEFNPISNVIWLHYLVRKLIEEKGIPKPPGSSKFLPQLNDRPIRNQNHQSVIERLTREVAKVECLCHYLLVESEKTLSNLIQSSLSSPKPSTRSHSRRRTTALGSKSSNHTNEVLSSTPSLQDLSASNFLDWWNHQRTAIGL